MLLVSMGCHWHEGQDRERLHVGISWGFWERGVVRLREMWKKIVNVEIPLRASFRLHWAGLCKWGLDDICALARAIV